MKYDLEERVKKFGENVINMIKKIKINYINKNIIDQLLRSSTSIGANYFEANGPSSKKDFISKVAIAKKETIETQHWFRMLLETDINLEELVIPLWKEAKQLGKIFSAIIIKVRNKI